MKSAFWLGILSLAFAVAIPAASQSYKPPRNALGQPQLEGVWSYNSLSDRIATPPS